MYGYEEHIELTPEQILQKITQEKIFEFVLKQDFSFNKRYISPFRKDNHPGCRFELRMDGAIIFIDFGERLIHPTKTHRSCFGMVMDEYNTDLTGAIRIICSEFNLSTNIKDYSPINKSQYQFESISTTIINTDRRIEFNRSDIWYWSQFLIRPEHLNEDNVYSIKKFSIDNEKGYRVINTYKFCYEIDFLDAKKIYQPFKNKYKWITNCDENHIGNIDNLPRKGEELFIQKGYKDHRVLRNLEFNLNVIWFANEGCVPDIWILVNLVQRFKLITIFFDNDEPGVLAALKLYKIFNELREGCCRIVHLPIFISGKFTYKNTSDFINKEGRKDLIEVLKQTKIL